MVQVQQEDGVRRAERYTYWSLHMGLPTLLLLALASVPAKPDPSWTLAWTGVLILLNLCGLVVLHTGLRRRGDLRPSGWDRWFLRRRTGPFLAGWLVTAVLAALMTPEGLPDGLLNEYLLGPVFVCLVAGVAALPGFGLSGRMRILGPFALAAALALLIVVAAEERPPFIPMATISLVWCWMLLSLSVMFLNLVSATQELDRSRRESARNAVSEERLRFSRDLHDVFGRTLSAVALKAELAAAQAEAGRPEAAAGMREVQGIATDALAEVRDLVRGYRDVDLAAELNGARALLESAGIVVTTVSDSGHLPGPVARTFAWVVREAATNVLRHSAATQVRIDLSGDQDGARLRVTNDRPQPASGQAGSGLTGLTERLADVGGTLNQALQDDHFVLTAQVPADTLSRLRAAERSAT